MMQQGDCKLTFWFSSQQIVHDQLLGLEDVLCISMGMFSKS